MIGLIAVLLVTTIFFFITSLHYKHKYIVNHNLVEILDESTLMYYKKMVDIDLENEMLRKQHEAIKLENAELRSGIHTGFPKPTI
jgi:hypothetical protein